MVRSALAKGKKAYLFRFNAPNLYPKYPAYYGPAHSADNSYLQNATATMNTTEEAVALECVPCLLSFLQQGQEKLILADLRRWRAYVSSFLAHSEYVLSSSHSIFSRN
jgi:hypothetical protein